MAWLSCVVTRRVNHSAANDVFWYVYTTILRKPVQNVIGYTAVKPLNSINANAVLGCMEQVNEGLRAGSLVKSKTETNVSAFVFWTLHTRCPEQYCMQSI